MGYKNFLKQWTVPGEPSGYQACSVVWTHDSWHDAISVVGDWTYNGVSSELVIFKDSVYSIVLKDPTGLES